MRSHSGSIGRGTRSRRPNSFCDIEDDTGETIFIQVNFLVVRNLSYCTIEIVSCDIDDFEFSSGGEVGRGCFGVGLIFFLT